MARVGIVSCGIVPFSTDDQKIESILFDSARALFENTDIRQDKVDAVLVSTNSNSKYLAPIVSEMCGIEPRIAHSVESMCGSGANSIVSAYSYIASGLADVVMVCGAERFDSPGRVLEWDDSRGEYKHPVFWASMFSKSYKREFGITDEQLAIVPVKNSKQARRNPNAIPGKSHSVEDVLNSTKITDDLRLLDCSRPCTGGAAILLGSEKMAKFSYNPVWITGIGQKTISGGFLKNPSLTSIESAKMAGDAALRMSGRSIDSVDVAEIHDAFAVCEPMILESLGFSNKGKGIETVKDLHESDDYKINPRGGLLGAGHPLGATGIAQTVEIAQQLSSCAAGRQVSGADVGLVHNMSAAATSSTVMVLER